MINCDYRFLQGFRIVVTVVVSLFTLQSCTSLHPHAAYKQKTELPQVHERAISGLLQTVNIDEWHEDPDQIKVSTSKNGSNHLKVLIVHGISCRSPGYSENLQRRFAERFGYKSIELVSGMTAAHKGATVALHTNAIDYSFDDSRIDDIYDKQCKRPPNDRVEGETTLRIRRYGKIDGSTHKTISFYEVTWSSILQKRKKQLLSNELAQSSEMRLLNHLLKQRLLNETLSDVIAYLGADHHDIVHTVEKSLCLMFEDDWLQHSLAETLKNLNSITGNGQCYLRFKDLKDSKLENGVERKITLPAWQSLDTYGYSSLTYSLGSRIFLDTLMSDNVIDHVFDITEHFKQGYFLANQVPLLELWSGQVTDLDVDLSGYEDKFIGTHFKKWLLSDSPGNLGKALENDRDAAREHLKAEASKAAREKLYATYNADVDRLNNAIYGERGVAKRLSQAKFAFEGSEESQEKIIQSIKELQLKLEQTESAINTKQQNILPLQNKLAYILLTNIEQNADKVSKYKNEIAAELNRANGELREVAFSSTDVAVINKLNTIQEQLDDQDNKRFETHFKALEEIESTNQAGLVVNLLKETVSYIQGGWGKDQEDIWEEQIDVLKDCVTASFDAFEEVADYELDTSLLSGLSLTELDTFINLKARFDESELNQYEDSILDYIENSKEARKCKTLGNGEWSCIPNPSFKFDDFAKLCAVTENDSVAYYPSLDMPKISDLARPDITVESIDTEVMLSVQNFVSDECGDKALSNYSDMSLDLTFTGQQRSCRERLASLLSESPASSVSVDDLTDTVELSKDIDDILDELKELESEKQQQDKKISDLEKEEIEYANKSIEYSQLVTHLTAREENLNGQLIQSRAFLTKMTENKFNAGGASAANRFLALAEPNTLRVAQCDKLKASSVQEIWKSIGEQSAVQKNTQIATLQCQEVQDLFLKSKCEELRNLILEQELKQRSLADAPPSSHVNAISQYTKSESCKPLEEPKQPIKLIAISDPNDPLSYVVPKVFKEDFIKFYNIPIGLSQGIPLIYSSFEQSHNDFENNDNVLDIIGCGAVLKRTLRPMDEVYTWKREAC